MRRRWSLLAVLLGTLLALLSLVVEVSAAPAQTRQVTPTGSDSGDCTAAPCRTITYALAQAGPGDLVAVAAGTYAESLSVTQQVTLRGTDATIDAAGFDNGIVITGPGAAGTSVQGFTIQHAGLEGIFAHRTSQLALAGNTLVQNDAYGPFDYRCVDQPDDCGEALHLQSVTNSLVAQNVIHDNVGGILLTDEDGPTSGNTIRDNEVTNNTVDCGITLASHWFQLDEPVAAGTSGIYGNRILHNVSSGNGAAGIGIFAGPPGAAAYDNLVVGNTAVGNGLPGVAIHSHAPFQRVDGNVILNNTLTGNGPDDDSPGDDAATGISIFSAVVPISRLTVASNWISDATYGLFSVNAVHIAGLPSNHFSASVVTPITVN